MPNRPSNENTSDVTQGILSRIFTSVARKYPRAVRVMKEIGALPEHIASVYKGSPTIYDLQQESYTDSLTGLPNRNAFNNALTRMIESSIRHPLADPLSVVFCDLDGFKKINDTLGHDQGDLALQDMATMFKRLIHPRRSDLFGRLGGDEFAYIGIGNRIKIEKIFLDLQHDLDIRKTATSITDPNGIPYDVKPRDRHGMSYGVACLNETFISEYGCKNFSDLQQLIQNGTMTSSRIAADLVKEADHNMYANKIRRNGQRAIPPISTTFDMAA